MAAGFGAAGQLGQTYRDADGRVHYADGSVGPAVAAWNDGGNWTYAKNADVQGDMYRAQGLTPPGQSETNTKSPFQMSDVFTNTPSPYPLDGGGTTTGNNSPYQMPSASAAGGISNYTAGQNPYLQQQGDQMTQQMTQNLQRNVLPRINSAAAATGGMGGSRQGVVQSNAMSDMNNSLSSGLTNLYSQGYNQNLQYDLGRRNNDLGFQNSNNSYDLGLRGNDLGFAGLDAQINQNNFNNNMAGAQFGQGVWNQGMNNNQTGINAGTNIHNTPQNYWSQFGNQFNSIGQGYGATTGSSSQQGNPVMGALGGAQLGGRIGQMWGGSANAVGGSNSQGWGTGSGYGNQDLGMYF